MKIFLSWSGDHSKLAAYAVRKWFRHMIQGLEFWISEEDIGKGRVSVAQILTGLADAGAGIAFLTRESLPSPWLNFEGGALVQKVRPEPGEKLESRPVFTFLLGVKRADLSASPFAMFQHTNGSEAKDVRRLVGDIHKLLPKAQMQEEELDEVFKAWWPKLEAELLEAAKGAPAPAAGPTNEQMFSDILAAIYQLAGTLPSTVAQELERGKYSAGAWNVWDSHPEALPPWLGKRANWSNFIEAAGALLALKTAQDEAGVAGQKAFLEKIGGGSGDKNDPGDKK